MIKSISSNSKIYSFYKYHQIPRNHWILACRYMSNELTQSSKQSIRNFEQRLINRSVCDLMLLENIADYLLQCCSAQAKANTLSLFSMLPLLILSFIMPVHPSRIYFVLTLIALICQQIFDIANKKQAYRLQSFSFGTYYFDHLCDSFSVIFIIYNMGRLLSLNNNSLWYCIFAFGVLPFYIYHLGMYYGDYMYFGPLSPVSEGLIALEIICIVGLAAGREIFTKEIGGSINGSIIIIIIAVLWLIIGLISNIKNILKGNGLKNLFVIFVIGYIVFQMSVLEVDQVINEESNIVFGLFVYSLALCHSLIIGELLLKYGCNQSFMQISVNTLIFTAYLVISYAIFAFIDFKDEELKEGQKSTKSKVAIGIAIILALGSTVGYIYRSAQIKNIVNQAISE